MKNDRRFLCLLGCLLLVTGGAGAALGQSRFLDDGQSGAMVSIAAGTGEDYTSLGAGFGYSFGSKFELGLAFTRSSFDDEVIGEDGSGTEFTPYVLASVVRPTADSRLGLELGASYGFASFSSDGLDFLDWDMTGSALSIGGNLYLRLESSPSLTVYPLVSADYVTATVEIEDSYGDSVDEEVNEVAFGAGVALLFNRKVTVTPSFRSFDGDTSWGVSVGVVLPGA